MEKKRCPNCGKYVDADKTYCMGCGTTLGIRCPDCRAILPVGTKACTACGHSFLRKTPRKPSALGKFVRSHPRPILTITVFLCAVILLILACFPALNVSSPSTDGLPADSFQANGYALIGFLLGAHPNGVMSLLEIPALKDVTTSLRFSLYGAGLGWLTQLIASLLAVWLVLANRRGLGRTTARRLFPLAGCAFGGGALILTMELLIRSILGNSGAVAPTARSSVPFFSGSLALFMLVSVFVLYRYALRTAEESSDAAVTLGQAIVRPLRTLVRFAHRLFSRGRRGNRVEQRTERAVTCTRRFSVYLILLGGSLVFTQALLSKVSNIFFWFLLLLPGILLLYALIARHSITASMHTGSATIQKSTPYTYELCIHNHAPFVFPFVEALVSIPQSNAVRCRERTLCLPLAALCERSIRNTVSFRFRGTYDIGVRELYVYDLFRLFRVRIPVDAMTTVYVLPRRVGMEEELAISVADSTARTVRSHLTVDRLEVSDIRDYRAGDPLKSIHWKLSSKSEEFVVKDYNTGTSDQTIVFCDLSPHFPEQDPHSAPIEPTGKPKTKPPKQRNAHSKGRATPEPPPVALQIRRDGQTRDTHAISDEDLDARLKQREIAAGFRQKRNPKTSPDTTDASVSDNTAPPLMERDVQALASTAFYEDMNEYLADGVVELAIAVTLSELNRGREVQLIWFDRRSETGLHAFRLRGVDEFDRIYNLFGTAPLCRAEQSVSLLASLVNDAGSDRQLFVLPAMDEQLLNTLCRLPGSADASDAGGMEALLYEPAGRFRYPAERARFLEGCRRQLRISGVSLVVCGATVSTAESDTIPPNEKAKGGAANV